MGVELKPSGRKPYDSFQVAILAGGWDERGWDIDGRRQVAGSRERVETIVPA